MIAESLGIKSGASFAYYEVIRGTRGFKKLSTKTEICSVGQPLWVDSGYQVNEL